MKKSTPIIALFLVLVMLFSACNNSQTPEETTPEVSTPKVTTPVEATPEATTPTDDTVTEPSQTVVPLDPACEHDFTSRIVLTQVTTEADGEIANVCANCGGWQTETLAAVKSLKILAIGNSFSDNALKYLPALAKKLGIEEVYVGKLYIGSCDIDKHWQYAQTGGEYGSFQINTGDGWVNQDTKTLKYALECYDWDIITMQQVSGKSGMESSLGNLQNLIDFVNANKTNPNAKLYWHMTWAYSQFTGHGSFANYNNDQMTMYQAIVDLTKNCIVPNECFAGIIPAGTAVQNYRGTYINNSVMESDYITMSDGYHLRNFSEVLAAMTWIRTLTGLSLDGIRFTSNEDMYFAQGQLRTIKRAVEYAYLNPYEVNPA